MIEVQDQFVIGKIIIDGHECGFFENDTIGSCLIREGVYELRRSLKGEPRGIYCGIGICNDCLVTVNGNQNIRACVTKAKSGLVVFTGVSRR